MIAINLSKREKYIFIATITFIASVLLYNFIFEPGLKKWRAANNEILAKKAKMDKGIRLIQRKNAIIQEYNRYVKSTENISKILSYVEGLADSLGIRTSNMKPGQGIEKGLYKEYSIELQIEGRFPEIIKFLSELIKLPTFAALKKCDFRAVTENPSIFKGTIILSKIII
jgi:Tfp pilus assembly protein PilO